MERTLREIEEENRKLRRLADYLRKKNASLQKLLDEKDADFSKDLARIEQEHEAAMREAAGIRKREIELLESAKEKLQQELRHSRADSEEIIDDYRSAARFGKWVWELESLLGSSLTPRMIMLAKIASELFTAESPDPRGEAFPQSLEVHDLTPESLDGPLDIDGLVKFTRNLDKALNGHDLSLKSLLTLKYCAICEAPKFDYGSSRRVGNHELKFWVWCPFIDCQEFFEIRNEGQLANVLSRLGCQDIQSETSRYKTAMVLRKALESLDPRPTPEALEVSEDLHARLESRNVMYSFFDPRFQDLPVDAYGRIPAFSAGPVTTLMVNHEGQNYSVPIFLKFLKRKTASKGRVCSGCSELRCDVDFGSLEDWTETCRDLCGSWMWEILAFPEKMAEACGHVMDFCNGCVARHIKAQIEMFGRNVTERISCPSEGCGRKLSYDEVKLYADKETAQRYDRYLLLIANSKLPYFRWCARGECENGEVYEEESTEIACSACGYKMCYKHQMPWHEGLSCEEYDSIQKHGDPLYDATQSWIQQNSKKCPGKDCGLRIEKRIDGCFHMTFQYSRISYRVLFYRVHWHRTIGTAPTFGIETKHGRPRHVEKTRMEKWSTEMKQEEHDSLDLNWVATSSTRNVP
ncbi:hypothetical protein B0T19DRAFT_405477 [Cercophora scortea]|uniref:RBR-type E3 ubiquitin transferase n=1 Tax=Cercophora scortea TaxID=314031 RepID=A0AAE0I3B6_9PEZI|nr:hypothetical protein B0T19DRAFT_405477 [Cercophora scortea]